MDLFLGLLKPLLRRIAYRYAVKRARKTAILVYLKALQATRHGLIAALVAFFVLQLMVFGFLGAVITGVWLWPSLGTEAKLYILLGVFSALFLVPLAVLIYVFSERFWLRVSGADRMLEETKL